MRWVNSVDLDTIQVYSWLLLVVKILARIEYVVDTLALIYTVSISLEAFTSLPEKSKEDATMEQQRK